MLAQVRIEFERKAPRGGCLRSNSRGRAHVYQWPGVACATRASSSRSCLTLCFFLRISGGCEPFRLADADIARTTRTPLSNFAEMRTDLMMAAGPRFHKPANIAVTLPGTRFFRFVGQLIHEISQQADVALLPKKQAIRRSTIASRAARFL